MRSLIFKSLIDILCVYRFDNKIDFRPVDNLKQVVHRLGVGPHEPSHLCAVTSSASQLLYCDGHTDKIHRVDCSTAPPTPQGEIPIVYDGQEEVSDMCTLGEGVKVCSRTPWMEKS